MAVIQTKDPEVVVVTTSVSWAGRGIGLFFAAVGGAALASAASARNHELGHLILIGIGLLGLVSGGFVALYRSGIEVNRREKKARSWAKLLFFSLRNEEHSIDEAATVLLTPVESEDTRGESTHSYHVRIVMNEGWVTAGRYTQYERGQKTAQDLATFLSLHLEESVRF